jgi:hypothetical protein
MCKCDTAQYIVQVYCAYSGRCTPTCDWQDGGQRQGTMSCPTGSVRNASKHCALIHNYQLFRATKVAIKIQSTDKSEHWLCIGAGVLLGVRQVRAPRCLWRDDVWRGQRNANNVVSNRDCKKKRKKKKTIIFLLVLMDSSKMKNVDNTTRRKLITILQINW